MRLIPCGKATFSDQNVVAGLRPRNSAARIASGLVNGLETSLCQKPRMSEETERLTLRQADQAREDFAAIADDLDFIKEQLSRLATRREVWHRRRSIGR